MLVPTCRQVYHFFTAAKAKGDVLLRVLRSAAGDARDGVADGATLVFCADGATAEEVRARLAAELPADAPVAALHAATTADERRGALALFGAPDARGVLVADGLATRGLDLPGVRHVVLYDLPTDVTTYVHAAGRTRAARRGGARHVPRAEPRAAAGVLAVPLPPGAAAGGERVDVMSACCVCSSLRCVLYE